MCNIVMRLYEIVILMCFFIICWIQASPGIGINRNFYKDNPDRDMASRSILRAQVRTKSNTPVMCLHHKENKAVFVCLRPGCNAEFACVECVATNHRGHEMEKLDTYAAEKKILLKDKVKAMKDGVLGSLRQKLETTKNKITSNKTQTKDEQQKILNQCNALKAELDKIARKCTETCERTGEENDKKLTEHMECLESIYSKYKSELDKCEEVIEEGSDSDIVLAEREAPDTPVTPPFPNTGISLFKAGSITSQNLKDLFGAVTSMIDTTEISSALAKTNISDQPEAHEVSALSRPKVDIEVLSQFPFKGDNAFVCGLLYPLTKKQLYIWRIQSNIVSIVSYDGKVIDTVNLQHLADRNSYIMDTCVSPVDGTLWSVSSKGNIQQVKPDGKRLQSIKYFVDRDGKPQSLCATRSQEVVVGVICPSLVIILTTAGTVTRTLKPNSIGLISYPQGIKQCQRTGRLVVKESSCLSVLDEKYNHLYTIRGNTLISADGSSKATGYTCQKRFYPWRMSFDENGNLLVVDDANYKVIVFNRSGEYIYTLIQDMESSKRPCTISTAPDGTLWVEYRGDVFRQIKYK